MAEEVTVIPADQPAEKEGKAEAPAEDQRVPYERLERENQLKKQAESRAKALEKEMADLRAQLEERENAGLPELERMKKDLDRAAKRAEEAEQRATEADARVQRSQRERWITAAAQSQNFADPSDASAFLNLDDIEDEKGAERAVKRLAGQKKHLLKAEDPKLPGQVLENGRRTEKSGNGIDVSAEAEMLRDGLKQFASRE